MRTSLRKVFAVLSAMTLVLVFVVSCGDDDEEAQLTTEEYFLALDVLDDDYTAATEELEASFGQATQRATTEDEQIEALTAFVEDGAAALEDFVDGFAALSPPEELNELQDEAVSAGEAAIGVLNDLVGDLSGVTSMDEAQEVMAAAPTFEAFENLNAFCFEAESLADEAGVAVDYDCDDE